MRSSLALVLLLTLALPAAAAGVRPRPEFAIGFPVEPKQFARPSDRLTDALGE